MSTKKNLIPSKYGQRTYYMDQPIDFDVAINYATALMAIAGADGTLAEKELAWYLDEQTLNMEDATEYIEAVRGIDWKSANLEEILSKISYDFPLNFRHAMLYQAIKMSSADREYHAKERAAIAKAASTLGVENAAVAQLEALVAAEAANEQLRRALLTL